MNNLTILCHVFTPGAERVLDSAEHAEEQRVHLVALVTHELGQQLPALRRVRFTGCHVRPMPSASAMSVMVATEASALAIRNARELLIMGNSLHG